LAIKVRRNAQVLGGLQFEPLAGANRLYDDDLRCQWVLRRCSRYRAKVLGKLY